MAKYKSRKNRYKVKEKTELELLNSIRRDWHGMNPATKIFRDKTKYQRTQKHKKGMNTDEY